MRKRGFTLIELLVVIAIIALLLSIIMPAMGKAKDYVKRVVCCNNARQIVLGISVYSQHYDGKIMPMYDVNSGTRTVSRLVGGVQTVCLDTTSAPLLEPHNSYRVYSPSQAAAGKMRPFHLALLYEDRIIDTPDLFYCPAQPRSTAAYVIPYYYDFYIGQGNSSDYSNPAHIGNYEWGTVAPVDRRGGNNGLVRTSFNYWTYGHNSLQKISGFKPILFDNIQDWRVVPHRKSRDTNSNPQGLTVAYADGHVTFCNDPEIWEDNASNQPWNRAATAGRGPDENIGMGPGNEQAWFNEILRRLQAN